MSTPLRDAMLLVTRQVSDDEYGPEPRKFAYGRFHRGTDPKSIERLFNAGSVEERLKLAEEYAKDVLAVTDLEDAAAFRAAVRRRESDHSIAYEKHRDHVVHTVHNYLLGWYFFAHSKKIQDAFDAAFKSRKLLPEGEPAVEFGQAWVFSSLLHDIGYLLEGKLPDSLWKPIDGNVKNEMEWLENYFQEEIFEPTRIFTASDREAALRLANIAPIPAHSGLHTVDGTIKFLGDPGSVQGLASFIQSGGEYSCDLTNVSDAFSVWGAHYQEFEKEGNMASRMNALRTAFRNFATDGLPKKEVRVLDHGVCGALLLLKRSTFWFTLLFALKNVNPSDDNALRIRSKVLKDINFYSPNPAQGPMYKASHWWTTVVWATAAAALHNVQQTENMANEKLGLFDDPLAYLGILVDILQEWDRHPMRKDADRRPEEKPISNNEVTLKIDVSNKIVFRYPSAKLKKITTDLDRALLHWEELVAVEPLRRGRPRPHSATAKR
jgi:hypothetical protein